MITVRQDKEIYEIFTHYDPVIIEMIKQIPGRRWVPERKAWTIPRNNLGFFVNIFKGSEYESQITLLSDENIDINEDLGAHTPIPDIDISNVPFYVKEGAKPYQHQLDFMKWAIHRQNKGNLHGFLLADSMGLGKTVEVTNLALYNRDRYDLKHCLIICCINSSKYNWQKDIEIHTGGKEHAYIIGSRLKKNGSFKPDTGNKEKLEDLNTLKMYSKDEPLPYFIIMNIEAFRYKDKKNYPIADRIIQLINNDEIDMVVIDEIHKNASPEATQGKQLLRVKKATSNAMWIPMTGTPIVKDPSNLYTPLKLCDVHRFNSYWTWCQEFIIYAGFGSHDIVGYKNIPKLKQMLESNMIRRLKEDVLDLPPKIYYTEYIDNSPYQRKLYNEIAHQLQESRDEIIKLLNPLAKFLRLRQVNGSPELVDASISPDDSNYLEKNARLKRLLELLEDAHARGEKTVVFSNWVEPLQTLYKYISKKYKTCVFTGTMSVEERERHKETFMTNPAYTVLLGTIGAAGVSHTFTAARNLIFYDSPWNPSDKDQASDRIYRIGTTESVNIFTLVTRDTVDDRVEEILSTKDGVAKYIVDNKLDLRNNPKLFNYLLGGDK